MPHVKASMLPTYSRTAQLSINQEAQHIPDNREHAWKFAKSTTNAAHDFGRSMANTRQSSRHLIGITGSKLDMNHWRTNSAEASLQGTRTKYQRCRRLFTVS